MHQRNRISVAAIFVGVFIVTGVGCSELFVKRVPDAEPSRYGDRARTFTVADWDAYLRLRPTLPSEPKAGRISSADALTFPAERTFSLPTFRGNTYAHFLKTQLRPALDGLGAESDANPSGKGFDHVGARLYADQAAKLDMRTLAGYRGARWDTFRRAYLGGISHAQSAEVFEWVRKLRPHSSVEAITSQAAPANEFRLALQSLEFNATADDLAALYALTSGVGVKVELNSTNNNYHVLYRPGPTISDAADTGRSFVSTLNHSTNDPTVPEFLERLETFLKATEDPIPLYLGLFSALSDSDTRQWVTLSGEEQDLLADFFSLYSARALRRMGTGVPDRAACQTDLAAVTLLAPMSVKLGQIVVDGKLSRGKLVDWWTNSAPYSDGEIAGMGGMQCADLQKAQRAVDRVLNESPEGKKILNSIRSVTGIRSRKGDVIQSAIEFLSVDHPPGDAAETRSERAVAKSLGLTAKRFEGALADLAGFVNLHAKKIGVNLQTETVASK